MMARSYGQLGKEYAVRRLEAEPEVPSGRGATTSLGKNSMPRQFAGMATLSPGERAAVRTFAGLAFEEIKQAAAELNGAENIAIPMTPGPFVDGDSPEENVFVDGLKGYTWIAYLHLEPIDGAAELVGFARGIDLDNSKSVVLACKHTGGMIEVLQHGRLTEVEPGRFDVLFVGMGDGSVESMIKAGIEALL